MIINKNTGKPMESIKKLQNYKTAIPVLQEDKHTSLYTVFSRRLFTYSRAPDLVNIEYD